MEVAKCCWHAGACHEGPRGVPAEGVKRVHCEMLLWDKEGPDHWQDVAVRGTLAMVCGAGESQRKVQVKTLPAFSPRTLFSQSITGQPMPCSLCLRVAHWHGFLIVNMSKRCQPIAT